MIVIKYKTFKSSSDFEDWQIVAKPNIISIVPVTFQVDTQSSDKEFNVTIGAFVTYTGEDSAKL